MAFDFNRIIGRESTSCVKYDLREAVFGNPSILPMWVADMDIPTPDFIIDALRERLSHPVLAIPSVISITTMPLFGGISAATNGILILLGLNFAPGWLRV